MTQYIAIAGRKTTGKDTLADYIRERLGSKGFSSTKISFADPVKQICHVALELSFEDMNSQKGKEKLTDVRWATLDSWISEQFPDDQRKDAIFLTVRDVLKMVGTQLFRNLVDKDIWARLPFKVDNYDYVICPDTRFRNEVEAAQSANAYIVKILRPSVKNNDSHASEIELDNVPDSSFNYVMINDGTLDDVRATAHYIADKLMSLAKP